MSVTKISPALSSDQQRYAIESGIPIAPRRARKQVYPFLTMQVGDSFALQDGNIQEIERVRSAATYFRLRHAPMKFAVRQSDPITKAYRCWRIA